MKIKKAVIGWWVLQRRDINKSFPSCLNTLFQNMAKSKAIDIIIVFYSSANKTHFHQAPVVQTLTSALHWINHYPADKYFGETNCTIHWIEIYPVDSAIHLLNNWGQEGYALSIVLNVKVF